MANILFLINPRSGGSNASKVIKILREVASRQSIAVEELDFNELANQISKAKSFQTVVIGGGDGTISHALIYLVDHPRVGILPLGTANDLAREICVQQHLDLTNANSIIDFYRSNQTRQFSLGIIKYGENLLKKTHFINYVSLGFDAKVVSHFSKMRESKIWPYLKSVWGNRIGYFISCLMCLNYRLPNGIYLVNNDTQQKHHAGQRRGIVIANIRAIMGFGQSNFLGSPYDDETEALLINNLWGYLSMLFKISIPAIGPDYLGKAKSWNIIGTDQGCYFQVDGETRGDLASSQIEISIGTRINLIVPKV